MEDQAIIFADRTGIIRYWGKGACEFFGFTDKEAVGHSLDIIVPAEFREKHWSGFHAAMSTGKSRLNGAAHPGGFRYIVKMGLFAYLRGSSCSYKTPLDRLLALLRFIHVKPVQEKEYDLVNYIDP